MARAGRLTALASLLVLGGVLAGCQTVQDLHLSLPPELAAGAQRCAVQTESGWGGSTLKACDHSLKNVGGTTTTSSGSSWDAGLAGSRSTDRRIRFRYQFTASGGAMQEWRCERLEQEKVRHIARVLWKGEHEGSVSCATQTAAGEERYHYDTRQPDRVTWFQGGTAQVWTLVPQTRWLANGRLVDSAMPIGWCAYGEDGRILGCHDWISPGGVVWTVPQSQAQPRDLQRLVQLALGPKQLWGMD